jgi:hypothetical protein
MTARVAMYMHVYYLTSSLVVINLCEIPQE